MTAPEAIHTSTGRAAEALRSNDRGVIRRGNVADLVIVRGNAGEDIRALEAVETVILGGRAFGRNELLDEARRWAEEDREMN